MNTAISIPFTQTHEDVLFDLSKKVDQNSRHIQGIDQRTDGFGQRMDKLEHRMDNLDQRMDKLEHRMDNLDQRMDKLEHRMDIVEQRITENTVAIGRNFKEIYRLGVLMESQRTDIQTILEVVNHIDDRFRKLEKLDQRTENHEHRISAIELHLKPRN